MSLWVVATPLGNLGDLSVRAREVISKVDAVLCEDTRRTSNLISALGLSKSLHRVDHHSSPEEISKYVDRMSAGEVFAYVSDAGTPGISDPGSALVSAAYSADLRVSPLPGPSAVVTLLSVAGWNETAFSFQGFFPRKEKDRIEELGRCQESQAGRVFIWFESPERIVSALESIAAVVGEKAPSVEAVAAKELTKVYEKLYKCSVNELTQQIRQEIEIEGAIGEWVFALRFPPIVSSQSEGDGVWEKALQCCLHAGVSASRAAREVSQCFGVAKNEVYKRALELAEKEED